MHTRQLLRQSVDVEKPKNSRLSHYRLLLCRKSILTPWGNHFSDVFGLLRATRGNTQADPEDAELNPLMSLATFFDRFG